jgi:hypothetical protein
MNQENSICVFSQDGKVLFKTGHPAPDKKKKQFNMKRRIVNDIFESIRVFNSDPFWDMFLAKASRNKFPKGFDFLNDKLMYSYNMETFYLVVNEVNQQQFDSIKKFVSEKGIFSDTDRSNQLMNQTLFDEEEEEPVENWKGLGKIQRNAIFEYIKILVDKYDLNKEETDHLKNTMRIGIASGFLNDGNIIVSQSEIVNINNLVWDESKRCFDIDTDNIRLKKQKPRTKYDIKDQITSENTNTCLAFVKKYKIENVSKRWEKFLDSILKFP